MPVIHADTDGILDKCRECGGLPGWEDSHYYEGQTRARCTDCPNIGPWRRSWHAASIEWNVCQRGNKTK